MTRQVVLHVGGADSVHAVYVNGRFAGYGTDSRLASEYDITPHLVAGRNDLAIVGRAVQRAQLRRGPGPVVDGGPPP